MKTVLIVIAVLIGLGLLGFLSPAAIGAGIGWFCFMFEFKILGIVSIILGIIVNVFYLMSIFGSAGPVRYDGSFDDEPQDDRIGFAEGFVAAHIFEDIRKEK